MKKREKDWRLNTTTEKASTNWDVPLEDLDWVKFLYDCDCFPDGEERLDR
jgi:hypothetical protein